MRMAFLKKLFAITKIKKETEFKSVKIGNQVWMAENLDVSTFRNGDPIPEVKLNEDWKRTGDKDKPAWCHYNSNPEKKEIYGSAFLVVRPFIPERIQQNHLKDGR